MLDPALSRRERQIVEALYTLGAASARDVAEQIGEIEALDSVRVTLIGLEKKGLVQHRTEGRRHIYSPAEAREQASAAALKNVTTTFFGGSPKRALVAMLGLAGNSLKPEDVDELVRLVQSRAKKGGKQ